MRAGLASSRIATAARPTWRLQTNRAAHPWPAPAGASPMQDILWIGLFLTLLAASLGYVALCQRA
jgi:hypothetical protein